MSKNKFFSFPFLVIVCAEMFLYSIFFLILSIKNGWIDFCVISIISILASTPLLIYSSPRIEINNSGFVKRIFGKTIQSINWEEINQIEIQQSGRFSCIIISKSRSQYRAIYRNSIIKQSRKDDICLIYKKKIIKSINQFAPPHLQQITKA